MAVETVHALVLERLGDSPRVEPDGSVAAGLLEVKKRVVWVGEDVRDLDDLPLEQCSSDDRSLSRNVALLSDQVLVLRREALERDDSVDVIVTPRDFAVVRLGKAHGVLDHRLQDGVQVEGRLRDRLDEVADRGLALLGSPPLATELGELVLEIGLLAHEGVREGVRKPYSGAPNACL